MTDWVRLWHDMPTDPKWRVIARKSGQPLPCVIALFTLMLTTASAADDRGCIASLTDEDAAAALDLDEEDVAAIRSAMQGRVLDGDRLSGWERRQPKRERERENDNSTDRVRAHRAAQKAALPASETPRNATQHHETPREETDKIQNHPTTQPSTSGVVVRDERLSAVCQAAGWSPRTAAQLERAEAELAGWLAGSFDFDQDILPGIEQVIREKPGTTNSLQRFTATIRSLHAHRSAQAPAKPAKPDPRAAERMAQVAAMQEAEDDTCREIRRTLLDKIGPGFMARYLEQSVLRFERGWLHVHMANGFFATQARDAWGHDIEGIASAITGSTVLAKFEGEWPPGAGEGTGLREVVRATG